SLLNSWKVIRRCTDPTVLFWTEGSNSARQGAPTEMPGRLLPVHRVPAVDDLELILQVGHAPGPLFDPILQFQHDGDGIMVLPVVPGSHFGFEHRCENVFGTPGFVKGFAVRELDGRAVMAEHNGNPAVLVRSGQGRLRSEERRVGKDRRSRGA